MDTNNPINPKGKKFNIILTQEEFSSLTNEKYIYIRNKYKIKQWKLRFDNLMTLNDNNNVHIPKLKVYYKNSCAPEKDLNNLLSDIKEKIIELTDGIKPDDSDINKFSVIYKRIAENITYDYDVCKINEKKRNHEIISTNELEKSNNSQNLQGLLSRTSVCAGYSRILQCALNSVGVDCKWIEGQACSNDEKEQGSHAWNQVKIDDTWYNTDLTWDRDDIIEGNAPIDFCLKSDDDFVFHKPIESQDIAKCDESYPVENIFKIFYLDNLKGDLDLIEPTASSSELSQVDLNTQNTKLNCHIVKVEDNAITKIGNSIKGKVTDLLKRMRVLLGYSDLKNKQKNIQKDKHNTDNNCIQNNNFNEKNVTSSWKLENWNRREANKKYSDVSKSNQISNTKNNEKNNKIDSQEIDR